MKQKNVNEYATEKKALCGEDYDARKTTLSKDQINLTNLIISKYQFLYPVQIEKYSTFSSISGWMCKNLETNCFKVIPSLVARKMFLNNYSNYSYFGVKLVKEEMTYTNINEKQYREEFLQEALSYNKGGQSYADEYRQKYSDEAEIDKHVGNLKRNITYFNSLSKTEFENEIQRIVGLYHFQEVEDLSSFKNCLYLAVLDNYKQFYVGKSVGSLSSRMRKHWMAKIIPARQLWHGGYEFSRLKYDDFKLFDNTRMFVCTAIDEIVNENQNLANNPNIECTNLFGLEFFENMDNLDKAERIVIDDCLCMFCLSDRTPLLDCPMYDKRFEKYNVTKKTIKIRHYIMLDEHKMLERTPERIAFIQSLKKKK